MVWTKDKVTPGEYIIVVEGTMKNAITNVSGQNRLGAQGLPMYIDYCEKHVVVGTKALLEKLRKLKKLHREQAVKIRVITEAIVLRNVL